MRRPGIEGVGGPAIVPPVAPMLADAVERLPSGERWIFEPKWDGFRGILFHLPEGTRLQSRSGKALGPYFPEILRAGRWLPVGTVLDGELIVWREHGRTSFAALQRRLSAGRQVMRLAREYPAHLVVFDLLADADGPWLDQPLRLRRTRLVELLAGAPPELVLCPQTTDVEEAREWMRTWTAAGVEGVVAKRADRPYRPGRRGWRKLRVRHTVEAIIGGVTGTLSHPEALLLGRHDADGRLHYVGRTGPLTDAHRGELRAVLTRAGPARGGGTDHPWPQPLPATWTGQLDRAQPLTYVQVQPTVVAEVAVDAAYEHRRWRHIARYVRCRFDLSVYDTPLLTSGEM
ncbi:ATP-dependent DNA ligase [Pilimelia anulata]|uniref:DNA ligase (ATP) n=1 Tax=Pilimelia anulata TaxID=53371 RepID=A0A8J3B938_9ACTN|nr:ATP-dependent DNA ligase [Pilimelia anulata]GGJ89709.1 ATP-dependent DNA ligase [Pilimelia anulata]